MLNLKEMKRGTRLRLKIVSLVCALLITTLSLIPFWSRDSDARLLSLVFGALAAGALLRDLIADLREKPQGPDESRA